MHPSPSADRFLALHLHRLGADLAVRQGRAGAGGAFATVAQGAVASASGAATLAGVRAGDSLLRARGRCPDIRFAPADPGGEARLLSALARLAARAGLEAWTYGTCTLAGRVAPGAGAELRALVAAMGAASSLGIAARPGIADVAGAAALLARHAHGGPGGDDALWMAPPGGTAAALAPLPVGALSLAAPVERAVLAAGLDRIGALMSLGQVRIAGRYGLDVARQVAALTGTDRRRETLATPAAIVPLPARGARRQLGGGALTAAAPPGPGPMTHTATGLAAAARRARRIADLPSGGEDLAPILLRALPDGGALIGWPPEPIRALGGGAPTGGAFSWRARDYAALPSAASPFDTGAESPGGERAQEGWRVPTGSGAVLWLTRGRTGWACAGAFV